METLFVDSSQALKKVLFSRKIGFLAGQVTFKVDLHDGQGLRRAIIQLNH